MLAKSCLRASSGISEPVAGMGTSCGADVFPFSGAEDGPDAGLSREGRGLASSIFEARQLTTVFFLPFGGLVSGEKIPTT